MVIYVVVQFYPWFNFDLPSFDIRNYILEKNNGKSKLN